MKILKTNEFQVAYRFRTTQLLPESPTELEGFRLIKNPLLYWCADPFVFSLNEKNYLVAELASKLTRKGHIGIMCLDDKKPKWRTIIKGNNHFSYPNIFEHNKVLFIMPETKENQNVVLYKCISFPNIWEKNETLFENVEFVDTSFVNGRKNSIYTYDMSKKPYILKFYNNKKLIEYYDDESEILRPAGNNIVIGTGDVLYPFQYNTNFYGEKIVFKKKKRGSFIPYSELSPINLSLYFKKKSIIGCHTYNYNEHIETIDVVISRLSFFGILNKFYIRLIKLIKKIF